MFFPFAIFFLHVVPGYDFEGYVSVGWCVLYFVFCHHTSSSIRKTRATQPAIFKALQLLRECEESDDKYLRGTQRLSMSPSIRRSMSYVLPGRRPACHGSVDCITTSVRLSQHFDPKKYFFFTTEL